ncbi:hypothetical protein HHX47_DHR2000969 [Lentinula edodes]|nr:hypothetical protein HHX47_DHR2000969 [Lentinula edodes]
MFNPLGPPLDVLTRTKSQSRPTHRSSKSTPQPLEAASPAARAAIALEYASLRNRSHCPLGLYVVPAADTILIWDAVLFIHQGLPNQHHVFDVLHFIKAAFKRDVLDKIEEADCLNKEAYKYHESTTSFAALATQTSSLSHSDTALYEKDQLSLKTKPLHAMPFSKVKAKTLKEERERLGLKEWKMDQ